MPVGLAAGLVLVSSFVVLIIGTFLSPPGIYSEPDIEARMAIVRDNLPRWYASQAVSAFALGLAPAGYVLLAIEHLQIGGGPLSLLGSGFFGAGGFLAELNQIRYAIDPSAFWERNSGLLQAAIWLMLGGSLLLGVAFLLGPLPPWSGHLAIAITFCSAVAYFLGRMPSFYVLALLYLVAMLVGARLVWGLPRPDVSLWNLLMTL